MTLKLRRSIWLLSIILISRLAGGQQVTGNPADQPATKTQGSTSGAAPGAATKPAPEVRSPESTPTVKKTGDTETQSQPAKETQSVYVKGGFQSVLGRTGCVTDPNKLQDYKLWLETSKGASSQTLVSVCGDSLVFLQPDLIGAKPISVILADAAGKNAPVIVPYPVQAVLLVQRDYSPLFTNADAKDIQGECFTKDGLAKHNFAAWLESGGTTYQATVETLCKKSAAFSASGLDTQFPSKITLQDNSNGTLLIPHPQENEVPEDFPTEGDFSSLTKDATGTEKCFEPSVLRSRFKAWVQVGATRYEAEVRSLCEHGALFRARDLGKQLPTTITIQDSSNGQLLTVPYVAPVALKVFSVPFFSPEFVKLCKDQNPASCPRTDAELEELKVDVLPPEGVKDKPKVSVLHADMAVVKFMAPVDYRAKTVVVTSPDTKQAVMVRDLPGPQPITTQPNVSFSVVDPNTVEHNFGGRIAGRYIAVDLQIKNPGVKKIQVQKSSIWFEADYIAAARQATWAKRRGLFFRKPAIYDGEPAAYPWPCEEARSATPNVQSAGAGATDNKKAENTTPNVQATETRATHNKKAENLTPSPWTTERKAEHDAVCSKHPKPLGTGQPKVFRYGLEHRHQLFPETYAVVQGTFDDISGSLKDANDITYTATAGASGLSSLIKGRSYLPALSAFSAIILPAIQDIVFNQEKERRLRSQLLDQAFPEIVQIPPVSSATWKVFLPKRVISNDFPEIVLVEQLRDVHMELETVSEPLTEGVVKGQITIGMTQEQVIQALGVPSRTQTDDKTGKVTWSYDQGPYQSVEFTRDQNKQLKVTSFVQRLAAPEVTATPGEQKITLNWNPIYGATSYNIYRGTDAGGEGKTPFNKAGITDTSFTDAGATGTTPYYYQVTAVNAEGEGERSKEVPAIPKAAAQPSAKEQGTQPTTPTPPRAGSTQQPVRQPKPNGATSKRS